MYATVQIDTVQIKLLLERPWPLSFAFPGEKIIVIVSKFAEGEITMPYLYRLSMPTLCILPGDGSHPTALTLPEDALIRVASLTIDSNPENGSSLVEAQWEDKKVLLFDRDIRERGECLNTASSD